jgi:hypothetical protein
MSVRGTDTVGITFLKYGIIRTESLEEYRFAPRNQQASDGNNKTVVRKRKKKQTLWLGIALSPHRTGPQQVHDGGHHHPRHRQQHEVSATPYNIRKIGTGICQSIKVTQVQNFRYGCGKDPKSPVTD